MTDKTKGTKGISAFIVESGFPGFSVGKIALFTAVTIHSKSGKEYPLTGFPAKKLQDWLRQAGVQEI